MPTPPDPTQGRPSSGKGAPTIQPRGPKDSSGSSKTRIDPGSGEP
jgi:hypothetical protein